MEKITATKVIEPLETNLVEYVKEHLSTKISKSKLDPIETYEGGDVYNFGDDETGYYVLVVRNEVVYFVRYKKIKHNQMHFGRQVLVYSNRVVPETAEFARYIFFQKLLPRYHSLIADQLQTPDGKRFWQYSMIYSFGKHYVYFLDRRSSPNRLIQLHNRSDMNLYGDQLWGTTEGHKRTFAVISDRALKLATK